MKQEAIDKASKRLQKATEALKRMERPASHDAFASDWGDFLMALNGIYEALGAGSKDDPKSNPWFGRKRNIRKSDPLLRYMHAARNVEEHGLAPVTKPTPGFITANGNTKPVDSPTISVSIADFLAMQQGGPITIQAGGEHLVTVTDTRFGDSFDPPTEHLGQRLRDTYILGIAEVALAYHKDLIEEAKKFVA